MTQMCTVLVLGAGASYPYGFPLGDRLKQGMLEELHPLLVSGGLVNHGYSPDLAGQFQRVLLESSVLTIDELLEKKRDFREIGAHLIAATIIRHEHRANIFPKNDWYAQLYRQLDFESNVSDLSELSVVTFNYDRSLEFFLDRALEVDCDNRYIDAARKKLKSIKIVHPHGSIGKYPDVGYRIDPNNTEAIRRAAANVKIPSDELDDSSEYQEAQMLAAKADRVVFLGFGYHDSILKKLFAKT